MKRYTDATLVMCVPMLLFFSGCLEEHVRTTISADGSSERIISMKLPSKNLPDKAFPVPVGSSWSVEWKETGEKDSTSKYEYIARKTFRTPDDLHHEYAALPDTGALGITISVNKRFGWFFTYIDYQETYTYRNPFGNVPISNYLTKEEIERFQRDDKNDSLNRKVERWSDRDEFEEFYRLLVAETRRRSDPALPASLLEEKKEECFARVEAVDSANKRADKNAVDLTTIPLNNAQDVLNILTKVLKTNAILDLLPVAEQGLAVIEEKENRVKHPDGWTYEVQMPGLILETNSNAVEGNTITWKFNPNQIKVGNYTMRAASRVSNMWAFVVTGIAALLIVLIVIRSSFHYEPLSRKIH